MVSLPAGPVLGVTPIFESCLALSIISVRRTFRQGFPCSNDSALSVRQTTPQLLVPPVPTFPRFFKKVGCSWDENQLFVLTLQSPQRLAVQTNDPFVERAHEEQNRGVKPSQDFGRQIRPTSARDNSRNQLGSCAAAARAAAAPVLAPKSPMGRSLVDGCR